MYACYKLILNNKFSTEKWAMFYRHFDHHNTDTNMFVERYSYSMLHSRDACYTYMHTIYD